jgi:hypothetical protein
MQCLYDEALDILLACAVKQFNRDASQQALARAIEIVASRTTDRDPAARRPRIMLRAWLAPRSGKALATSGRGRCIDCGEFLPTAEGKYWH